MNITYGIIVLVISMACAWYLVSKVGSADSGKIYLVALLPALYVLFFTGRSKEWRNSFPSDVPTSNPFRGGRRWFGF